MGSRIARCLFVGFVGIACSADGERTSAPQSGVAGQAGAAAAGSAAAPNGGAGGGNAGASVGGQAVGPGGTVNGGGAANGDAGKSGGAASAGAGASGGAGKSGASAGAGKSGGAASAGAGAGGAGAGGDAGAGGGAGGALCEKGTPLANGCWTRQPLPDPPDGFIPYLSMLPAPGGGVLAQTLSGNEVVFATLQPPMHTWSLVGSLPMPTLFHRAVVLPSARMFLWSAQPTSQTIASWNVAYSGPNLGPFVERKLPPPWDKGAVAIAAVGERVLLVGKPTGAATGDWALYDPQTEALVPGTLPAGITAGDGSCLVSASGDRVVLVTQNAWLRFDPDTADWTGILKGLAALYPAAAADPSSSLVFAAPLAGGSPMLQYDLDTGKQKQLAAAPSKLSLDGPQRRCGRLIRNRWYMFGTINSFGQQDFAFDTATNVWGSLTSASLPFCGLVPYAGAAICADGKTLVDVTPL